MNTEQKIIKNKVGLLKAFRDAGKRFRRLQGHGLLA
jgi:hypothetical protein